MEYNKTHMWREISQTSEVIKNITDSTVINSEIAKIVAETEKRGLKSIALAGRGTSDHALIYFKYIMEIATTYNAGLVAPSTITLYGGKVSYGDSLVIGCSQSGYAADVVEVVKQANRQGGLTVAITNDVDSPLAKEAAFHLCLSTDKEISVAATKTFSAQLCILLRLAAAFSKDKNIQAEADKLPSIIPSFFESTDKLTDLSYTDLKDMKDGFILARGITYSVAFESGLKLQETSYIRMRGYAMSDFYHGPMAMINEGTNVLVYAPKYYGGGDENNFVAEQKKCVDKILELGGKVTIITDSQNLNEYKNKDRIFFRQFDNPSGEISSMFGFALFAQMLACKISCGIGNDPDNPKALNKVTITK